MKYRIGEVAELFGLTKGGVRFLEKKGVIRSHREVNGYRYYDRKQITDIKQLRSYQAMGFSMEEALELMKCDDPEHVLFCIGKKEQELTVQIEQIQRMLSALRRHEDRVSSALSAVSGWVKAPRPALYRISVWEDLAAHGVLPVKTDEKALQRHKAAEASFVSHMPEVALSLLLRKMPEGYLIARGSCIDQEDAHRLNVVINDQVDVYPAHANCYRAVIKSCENDRSLDEIFAQAERMERRGERLCGDIIGRMLLWQKCRNSFITYHEFWIPYENDIDKTIT